MNIRASRLRHVAIAAVAAVLGCSSPETTAEKQPPAAVTREIGSSADFQVEDYAGKVLVVNFWATWCGPCRIEMPALVKLRKSFEHEQVAIVGIAVNEHGTPEQIDDQLKRFVAAQQLNYPIYYDERLVWVRRFNRGPQLMIPLTIVFDQKGQVQHRHTGVPQDRSGRFDPFSVLGEEIQSLLDSA